MKSFRHFVLINFVIIFSVSCTIRSPLRNPISSIVDADTPVNNEGLRLQPVRNSSPNIPNVSGSIPSPEIITLPYCIARALEIADGLRIARERYVQAQYDRNLVTAGVLPRVSFQGRHFEQPVIPGARDDDFGMENQKIKNDYYISITSPIFSGFRNLAAGRAAAAVAKSREANIIGERNLVASEVTRTYYDILLFEMAIDILDASIAVQEQRVDELDYRLEVGDARLSEKFATQSELEKDRESLLRVYEQRSRAIIELSYLTGVPINARFDDPTGASSVANLEEYVDFAIAHRPDLEALRLLVDARVDEVKYAFGSFSPNIDLSFDYYTHREGFQKDVDWDLLLKAEVPLFAGGKNITEVRKAQSRHREAQIEYSQRIREVDRQIRDVYAKIQSSEKILKTLNKRVAIVRKSYEQTAEEYKAGSVSNLDLLTASNLAQEAELSREREQIRGRYLQVQLDLTAGKFPFDIDEFEPE